MGEKEAILKLLHAFFKEGHKVRSGARKEELMEEFESFRIKHHEAIRHLKIGGDVKDIAINN